MFHIWYVDHVTAGSLPAGTVGTPPTTDPPQALRRQSQRLSRFGDLLERIGRPDGREAVVVVASSY